MGVIFRERFATFCLDSLVGEVLVGAHALVFESSAVVPASLLFLSLLGFHHKVTQDIQVFTVNKCTDIVDKACLVNVPGLCLQKCSCAQANTSGHVTEESSVSVCRKHWSSRRPNLAVTFFCSQKRSFDVNST